MEIQTLTLGHLESNCYIVTDDQSGEIAVIDPGFLQRSLINAVTKAKDKIRLILLTHGHFDHLMGAAGVKELTGARVAIHALDADGLSDPRKSLAVHAGANFYKKQTPLAPDILLSDGDVLPLGSLRFQVLHTPGHTAGSVCFICSDVIFSGDTLFYESLGRTDFPTGSYEALAGSFKKLAALPGDYRVLPGHYEETTLAHERRYNPLANLFEDL